MLITALTLLLFDRNDNSDQSDVYNEILRRKTLSLNCKKLSNHTQSNLRRIIDYIIYNWSISYTY